MFVVFTLMICHKVITLFHNIFVVLNSYYSPLSKVNRRMAENGFAPPLGNFEDISYLVEN